MARRVEIGVMGLGTVGTGLVELIQRNHALIKSRSDVDLQIRRALVRDPSKARGLPPGIVTPDIDAFFNDDAIEIYVELIGGIEPARTYLLRALSRHRNVVTANKAVLAAYGDELFDEAARVKRQIGFEASICGGIPIIRALARGLVANRIDRLCGILNGTTNYILTRMYEDGMSYTDALARAQALGFAEKDPTLDVKGIDAAHKLLILAELTFQARVRMQDIIVEGIDQLDPEDFDAAKRLGFVIRLLAVGQLQGDNLDLRVHPAMVRKEHPLAAVRDEFNAVQISGDAVGDMIFVGKGAGAHPTASAVLSDIVEVARNPDGANIWNPSRSIHYDPIDPASRFYLRFPIDDKPGVIGQIASCLGAAGVSISHAEATLADVAGRGHVKVVTHRTHEEKIASALDELRRLPAVVKEPVAIRIFE